MRGLCSAWLGPPEALQKLTGGELSFMVSKEGDLMGDLVGGGGSITAKARFVREGGTALDAAAAAAAVAAVLSVATRQYYLHEINSKLATIDQKADEILGKLDDQRVAKYRAASATVAEVHTAAVDQLNRKGALDVRFPAEFWTRMSTAEQALREVIAECEADYDRHRQRWMAKLAELGEDGVWSRKKTQKRDDIETFEEISNWFTKTGTLHLQAVHSMTRWYQVALLHDTGVGSEDLQGRYAALSRFLDERRRYWKQQDVDEHVYLGLEGDHKFDRVRDVCRQSHGNSLASCGPKDRQNARGPSQGPQRGLRSLERDSRTVPSGDRHLLRDPRCEARCALAQGLRRHVAANQSALANRPGGCGTRT